MGRTIRSQRADRFHGAGRFAAARLPALTTLVSVLIGGRWLAFSAQDFGTPDPAARSTGHDALWLGHAWVSGQDTVAQVEQLASTLRGTGYQTSSSMSARCPTTGASIRRRRRRPRGSSARSMP